jgi:hypothetical protein
MIISFCSLSAQVEETIGPDSLRQDENPRFSDRLLFGSDLELNFGSITYIKLSPLAGIKVTKRLTTGLGPIYIYEKYKYREYHFETSTYGGEVFASFTVFRGTEKVSPIDIGDVMLHLENEVVNVEKYDDNKRLWIDNLLLGAGIYYPVSEKFGVTLYVLWDITQNKYSPYFSNNPTLKFRFIYNLGGN